MANWETIHDYAEGGVFDSTERMKVPGGWLYRSTRSEPVNTAGHMTTTFVPDPDLLVQVWNSRNDPLLVATREMRDEEDPSCSR